MKKHVLGFFQGFIIGAGAILPGISGASLAVLFGVYEDMTALAARPILGWKAFLAKQGALTLGIACGYPSFMLLIALFFNEHTQPLAFLFAGLIAGTVPGLLIAAHKKGTRMGELIATAIGFALPLLTILLGGEGDTATADVSFPGQWILTGGIIGSLSLLPGMSAALLLIPLGLYGPLVSSIRNFDVPALLQTAAGMVGSVILLSRLITLLYKKFHSIMEHGVLGATLGTVVLVFIVFASSNLLWVILPFALGTILSLFLSGTKKTGV